MFKEFTLSVLFLAIFFGLLLGGCSDDPSTPEASSATEIVAESISPISPVSPPPAPTATPRPKIKQAVMLDEPIKVGATVVTGTGPSNLPIEIYEVANTADLLGKTVIDEKGNFILTFDRPLRATERVGITLGDLSGTHFEIQDFSEVAIVEVPTYGYILADVSVQP